MGELTAVLMALRSSIRALTNSSSSVSSSSSASSSTRRDNPNQQPTPFLKVENKNSPS